MRLYKVYFISERVYQTLIIEAKNTNDVFNKIWLAYGEDTTITEIWEI